MTEVKNIIKKEIKKICFREVKDTELLMDSGLLDSISVVDLAVALENRLKVKIHLEDINKANFNTVDSIHTYMKKQMNEV